MWMSRGQRVSSRLCSIFSDIVLLVLVDLATIIRLQKLDKYSQKEKGRILVGFLALT